MNILQYDVRAFVDIARTIMDKLAKLIEKLLGILPGIGPRVSFTDHKKNLPNDHPNIHPAYLDFLQNRTFWFEQELLLLRDKVFAHGNTFYRRLKNHYNQDNMVTKRIINDTEDACQDVSPPLEVYSRRFNM